MFHRIVNPVAGNGRAARIGDKIEAKLIQRNVSFHRADTKYSGHATELACEAAASGAEGAIIVGGDGTTFEAVQGLVDTETAFGIIPAGTGNDFVKTTGTPSSPVEALDFILKSKPRPIDVGRLNDGLFLNMCGTGFDVCVLDYALKAKKYVRGLAPYLYGVIRTIFSFKPLRITLSIEGITIISKPMLVCSVGNGKYCGGGIKLSPHAEPDDGLLDIVIVENVSRGRMIRLLPGLLRGDILDFPETRHLRCKRATLSAEGMRLNADGEILPMPRADFEALSGRIKMYW